MEGKTHRIFAPLFTFGTSILLTRSGLLRHESTELLTVAIATVSSMLTATAPDGDLHVYKPYYVIWGLRSPNKQANGAYKVKTSGGTRQYREAGGLNMKIWGTFFRAIGTKKHRDFKSHSPVLWIPIWTALYMMVSKATATMEIGGILSSIVLGMGLGYISHIVGDIPNKSGVPFLPWGKNVSPVKRLPKFMQGFFKSGNKNLNKLVIFTTVNLLIIIVFGETVMPIYRGIFSMILSISKVFVNFLMKILTSLITLIRGK